MTSYPPSNGQWGQPGPGYSSGPSTPYGQQPSAPGQVPAGYGQPLPSYPTYAAPYGQPQMQGVVRPATTGIVGLSLVVLGTILATVFMLQGLGHFVDFAVYAEENAIYEGTVAYDQAMDRFVLDNLSTWMWVGFMSLIGLAGWIVCIVAMARNAGRGYGIGGLVLGILAPIVLPFVAVAYVGVEIAGQVP